METQRATALRMYQLLLAHDGRRIEFDATDASVALQRMQTLLPADAVASLFQDGAALGQVSYSDDGFWTIRKAAKYGAHRT